MPKRRLHMLVESTNVKMPHCCQSHALAQFLCENIYLLCSQDAAS